VTLAAWLDAGLSAARTTEGSSMDIEQAMEAVTSAIHTPDQMVRWLADLPVDVRELIEQSSTGTFFAPAYRVLAQAIARAQEMVAENKAASPVRRRVGWYCETHGFVASTHGAKGRYSKECPKARPVFVDV
jgi:hypothetical protein